MTIADRLAKNRVLVGAVLLACSWSAPFATTEISIGIFLVSTFVLVVGAGRYLSDYKAGLTQPDYTMADRIVAGLAVVTMMGASVYALTHRGRFDGMATIFPLLALIQLPRTRDPAAQQRQP